MLRVVAAETSSQLSTSLITLPSRKARFRQDESRKYVKRKFTQVRCRHRLSYRAEHYAGRCTYTALELMLCLRAFSLTGPPKRVDCLAPPPVST